MRVSLWLLLSWHVIGCDASSQLGYSCKVDSDCADHLRCSYKDHCTDAQLGSSCTVDSDCADHLRCSYEDRCTDPQLCSLEGQDYWHPRSAYLLVVFACWISPLYFVISRTPSLCQNQLKWFFGLTLPAFLFEVWTALASISAGERCNHADGSDLLNSGTLVLLIWGFDSFLWFTSAYYALWHWKQPSSVENLDDRMWELSGPVLSSKFGSCVLFMVGMAALHMMILEIGKKAPESSLDDDEEGNNTYLRYLINGWIFLILFCCFGGCAWNPRKFANKNCGLFRLVVQPRDDGEFNRLEIAKIRYFLLRGIFLDLGGFLLSVVNMNWMAVLFAVDEFCLLMKMGYISCRNQSLKTEEEEESDDDTQSDVEQAKGDDNKKDSEPETSVSQEVDNSSTANMSVSEEDLDNKDESERSREQGGKVTEESNKKNDYKSGAEEAQETIVREAPEAQDDAEASGSLDSECSATELKVMIQDDFETGALAETNGNLETSQDIQGIEISLIQAPSNDTTGWNILRSLWSR